MCLLSHDLEHDCVAPQAPSENKAFFTRTLGTSFHSFLLFFFIILAKLPLGSFGSGEITEVRGYVLISQCFQPNVNRHPCKAVSTLRKLLDVFFSHPLVMKQYMCIYFSRCSNSLIL